MSIRRGFIFGGRMLPPLVLALLLLAVRLSTAAAPQLTSRVPDFTVQEGDPLRIVILASDPDGDPLTCQLVTAPVGMTLRGDTLVWTPSYANLGTDTLIYSVRDPLLNTVADTAMLTVLALPAARWFSETTAASGLGDPGLTTAAAWADYDRDGDADLFLTEAGGLGKLYRAAGGSFTVASAGLSAPRAGPMPPPRPGMISTTMAGPTCMS